MKLTAKLKTTAPLTPDKQRQAVFPAAMPKNCCFSNETTIVAVVLKNRENTAEQSVDELLQV